MFHLGTPGGRLPRKIIGLPVRRADGQWYANLGHLDDIPTTVRLNTPREVEPGAHVPVQVTVTPPADCHGLTTRIHGLDGIQIDAKEHKHETCGPGIAVIDRAVARVPPGVHGFVVVEVEFDVEVDVKDGHYSKSFKLPLWALDKNPKERDAGASEPGRKTEAGVDSGTGR